MENNYNSIEELINDILKNPIESGGHIYHPIPFQEFKTLKITTNPKESYKKLDLILKTIKSIFDNKLSKLKILDIGANAGFYSYSLALKGMSVVSFEPNARYSKIARFLINYKKLNIEWINDEFNENYIKNQNFNLTLMLSVFQWMVQGGKNFSEAAKKLKFISDISDYLIFELGFNKGKSCLTTKKLNHYSELIKLLRENTHYTYFKLLGTTRLWHGNKRFLVLCSNNKRYEDNFLLKIIRYINI